MDSSHLSSVDAKKAWLKQLAAESITAWSTAVPPTELDGTVRLETRRTIYHLRDGVCVRVTRRSGAAADDERLIGLRIVGWLVDDRVHPSWRPGARAVLFRAEAAVAGESCLALTSPALGLVPEDPSSAKLLRPAPPPLVVPPPASGARLLSA